MRKSVVFVLAVLLSFSFAFNHVSIGESNGTLSEGQTNPMPADEYALAAWYGFLPDELAAADPDATIVTWAQYCAMLGRVNHAYDASVDPAWLKMTRNAPDTEMKRDGAMVSLLFAAKTMGCASFNADSPEPFGQYAPHVWDVVTMDYPVFEWNTPVDLGEGCSDSNHVGPAYDFCLRRVSARTGQSLLKFDENGDLRLEQPLTLREAALSAVRLYESAVEPLVVEEQTAAAEPIDLSDMDFSAADNWESAFLASTQERRQAILDNEQALPCEGTAYYVSNAGDDDNDGLSPETAWATLDRVNSGGFADGDVVYLERGGLWRGMLALPQGLSLSAYGSGAKPRLYGSPENGGGAEKWTLFSERDGKRIWVYHKQTTECGGIALGDTNVIAQRIHAWYDGSAFYRTEDRSIPFDLAQALCRDLTFYCDWQPEQATLPVNSGPPILDAFTLYLRCDKGNPGELYPSIEFFSQPVSQQQDALINADESCVIDNLSLQYFGTAIEVVKGNVTVQSCDIGYGGGFPIEYITPEAENGACVFVQGEGVFFAGSNVVIRDNYIHDIDGYGVNFEVCRSYEETAPLLPFTGNEIAANLIERCSVPVSVSMNLEQARNADVFGGMQICRNLLLNAGFGWYADRLSNVKPEIDAQEYNVSLLFGGFGDNGGSTISVSDNVFYRAGAFLVRTNADSDFPQFTNNVFAQRYGEKALWKQDREVLAYRNMQDGLRENYGDTNTAVLLRPSGSPSAEEERLANESAYEAYASFLGKEYAVPANEYERAMWYGFLPYRAIFSEPDGTVVTWAQYCAMLGRMLRSYDESAYIRWTEMTKNAPDTEMMRDGAMVSLLFAGEAMGLMYFNANADDAYSNYDWGHDMAWDYPVFDWQRPVSITQSCTDDNYAGPAFEYCMRRVSCVNALPLLKNANDGGDMRLDEPLTLREAAASVVRLYESDERVAEKTAEGVLTAAMKTDAAKRLAAEADARKQEILNSKTALVKSDTYTQGETYTGTAYYLSNHGSDRNDGLSPDAPFATIERLAKVEFAFGDAVFFERGGIWRMAELPRSITGTEGVTLSAYGEGEKPRLYASPENGGGAENWTLYFEGEHGEKIWKYAREMTDCPAMVAAGDRCIAKRDMAYWDGSAYKVYEDISQDYVLTEQLRNGELFVELPYEQSRSPEHLFYLDWDDEESRFKYLTGPLYVRMDEGNPGELYESIEFLAAYGLTDGLSEYTTFDNLHIGYSSRTLCLGGSADGNSVDHIMAQNTVVSWCGGQIHLFGDSAMTSQYGYARIDGGGFNTNGSYETIRNCYAHHCFQEGIALETFDDDTEHCEFVRLEDNVVEHCVMGLLVINWDETIRKEHLLKNITVKNNYVMYSGFENYYNIPNLLPPYDDGNWDWNAALGKLVTDTDAFDGKGGPNVNDGTIVSGNTFAFSLGSLARVNFYYEEYMHYLDGNIYAQLPGFSWFEIYNDGFEHGGARKRLTDAEEAVAWLHDQNATIVRLDNSVAGNAEQ